MYIPDMSNISKSTCVVVLAVGWLDIERTFPIRRLVESDVRLLKEFVAEAISKELLVHRTRGLHYCDFCNRRDIGSSAAILIKSAESEFFITNLLIAHYVDAHDYCPPEAFMTAVRRSGTACVPEKGVLSAFRITSFEGELIEAARMNRRIQRLQDQGLLVRKVD